MEKPETKNEAFHRLAQARKEALLDKIRLFGQLSGPSYDWTSDEVWAYFGEITQALEQALAKFQEQKRWGKADDTSPASTAPAAAQPDDGAEDAAPVASEPGLETPPLTREQRRRMTIGEMVVAAQNDPEMLPEMLVLQKEVIAKLQRDLDECRNHQSRGGLNGQ